MKARPSTLVLLAFLATFWAVAERFSTPTDMLSKGYPPHSMNFVLGPMEDLRELYSDKEVIDDRTKRMVCRVDSVFVTEWRRDVPVSTNSTVRDVLETIGLTKWNGGKQLRLLSKDALLQSRFPRRTGPGTKTWEQFAAQRVHPADILVICYSD